MRRHILFSALVILACSVAPSSQTAKQTTQAEQKPLPTLSAQEIFKRVSPSVMVVESLDAEGKVTKLGSGVVIAPGSIITNRHVIEDGASFLVEHSGKKWPAKLIKVDPDHDLAELSVAGLDAPAVTVLDSAKLAVGVTVYAIGSPEGLELTISEGLISGLREFDKGRVIQTSAAISPGSSGGGLFDSNGRLVGITTFYLKEGQSLNFALPAEWTVALKKQPAKATTAATEYSPAFQALVWFEVGYKAHEAGRYADAVRAYRQVLRLWPDYEGTWVNLGVDYGNLGWHDSEVSAYQEAIRLKPDDAKAWLNLGLAYEQLTQYAKAVSAEQEAIRLKPDNADAWAGLGLAYYGLGQRSEVINVYEKLKTLDPKLADKFFKLAVLP
jgi:Trypsin-like peptidase domain/Tetratricopeptide repeat